jgi:queuine tRNA-ribosyltransferase catalytic subunit
MNLVTPKQCTSTHTRLCRGKPLTARGGRRVRWGKSRCIEHDPSVCTRVYQHVHVRLPACTHTHTNHIMTQQQQQKDKPTNLTFHIAARCSTTRARTAYITTKHSTIPSPVFMPVGTKGSLKGMSSEQIRQAGCQIILANTYHMALKPGQQLLQQVGGLHTLMGWERSMLTDSGGFQMVSLVKLSQVTEQGVLFHSPVDGSPMMLTPEASIAMQNAIGADIIMQLDDVVSSLVTGPRVEEAMWRSIRWLDRCLAAHARPGEQSLFPIIQGGLDLELRRKCLQEMVQRDTEGYAIGGLSGGEAKDSFWRIVSLCTAHLPDDKPRYCMGVGYAEDLVVCSALGVDMYDCVFPTRTARFGNALTRRGPLNMKKPRFLADMGPLEAKCGCYTCRHFTRSYLHLLMSGKSTTACHYIILHNVAFQMRLMQDIRDAIVADAFPAFVRDFMFTYYKERHPDAGYVRGGLAEDVAAAAAADMDDSVGELQGDEAEDAEAAAARIQARRLEDEALVDGYPRWIVNALASVNVTLR